MANSFLHCHHRFKNGKDHCYWSIAEKVRTHRGWVQKHLLYLGEINDSQKAAWTKVIEVFDTGSLQTTELALYPAQHAIPDHAASYGVHVRLQEFALRRPRQWRCLLDRLPALGSTPTRRVLEGTFTRLTRGHLLSPVAKAEWSTRTSFPLLRRCSNSAGPALECRGDEKGQICAYELRFTQAFLNADFSGLQPQRGCGRGRRGRPGLVHSNEAKTTTLKTARAGVPERRFRCFVVVQIPGALF